MLVLSRKKGQTIVISNGEKTLNVVILALGKGRVKLGFDGSENFEVTRKELLEKKELKQ